MCLYIRQRNCPVVEPDVKKSRFRVYGGHQNWIMNETWT